MSESRSPPALRAPLRKFVELAPGAASETEAGERTLEVVASDETVDRYGDVITAEGWNLEPFKKNPVALWSHDYGAPIGTVEAIRVEGRQLLGRIKFAAKGVSARIDELWSLVSAGVLRAVSVGFTVNNEADFEPIRGVDDGVTGFRFLRQELLELSLVAVPANPNALALAKSLVADPRPYLHEAPMEPTSQPAGELRPLSGPCILSSAIPDDLATQVERSGRWSGEVRRSIRDIARVRNILGETLPVGGGVIPPSTVRVVDGFLAPAPLLLSLLPRVAVSGASITQNVIDYADPADAGNKAAKVLEAAAKPESDLFSTSSVKPFELWAHHIGVTKQALADIPALRQLVDSVLTRGLLLKIDGGVFTTLSTAAGVFTGAVGSTPADNAAVAAGQLAALGGSGIVVAMNPADLVGIDTAKASGSGVYVGRPPNTGQLVGVPSIPAGKLLAFASEAAYLAERESVNVVAGLANDDFTKNIVRLLAEWRGVTVIQLPALLLYGDAAGAVSAFSANKKAA